MNLNSLSLVVDFGHLPSEGFAALILAIIFTIITLAFVVYFFRHKELSKSKIWLAVIVLALPALSIFCWIYLIISITDLGIGACFYISFACAIGYALLMTLLGFILNKYVKHDDAETETKEVEAEKEETQETVEETKSEEKPVEEEPVEEVQEVEEPETESEMFTVEKKSKKD